MQNNYLDYLVQLHHVYNDRKLSVQKHDSKILKSWNFEFYFDVDLVLEVIINNTWNETDKPSDHSNNKIDVLISFG